MADEDRMDTLPNALLSVIVSSLPFKEAARTSILSKRWVNIWQSTKNIELRESFFVGRDEADQQIKERNRSRFINFATNFIRIHQESTVHNFSLSFSNPKSDSGFVDECIRFAVSHNVEFLELDFSKDEGNNNNNNNQREIAFDLPQIVYNHTNLRSLKLIACGFRAANLANPMAVKQLCLGLIEIEREGIKDLATKCAMLESLSVIKCWSESNFEIGGHDDGLNLKSLEIEKCRFLDDWISIELPILKYFRYSGNVLPSRIEVDYSKFKEADVEFDIDEEEDDDYETTDLANLICLFLDGLYPAKTLTVCSTSLQVIPNGDEPIKMQDPLTAQHLILKTDIHPNEFYGITFMMNSCPNLKKLTLLLGHGKIFQEYEPPFPMDIMSFWATNLSMVKCLSKCLERVEIKGFKGKQHEINLLAYLIHYGRRLRTLHVFIEYSPDIANNQIYIERAQILRTIPSASTNLRVLIS